jgi:hypothetical protein
MRVGSFAMGKGHGRDSCLIARLRFTAMDVNMAQVGRGGGECESFRSP